MSVELAPKELVFPLPLKPLSTISLRIKNPNQSPLAYKVKTTSPSTFCVKPNAGRLEAGKAVNVKIWLQPQVKPTAPGANDKFLVQSVYASAKLANLEHYDFWRVVEKQDKASIREQKLRVHYSRGSSRGSSASSSSRAMTSSKTGGTTAPTLQTKVQALVAQVQAKVAALPKVPLLLVIALLLVTVVVTAGATWFVIDQNLLQL